MILDDHFDRIIILSLPRCADRAARALRELLEKNLSETATVVRAIDGQICPPSDWWPSGRGAWGCMQSHYRAVQDALLDGVERLLVIEDDCIWQNDAAALAAEFLAQVPDDWGQIYFGGQHRSTHRPKWVEGMPAVLRAASVHRTHCYAIHRKWMAAMLKHISYAPDYIAAAKGAPAVSRHVDHQLEHAHRRGDWPVYAPAFWLAGQGENDSTINGRKAIPDQWWHLSWREAHRKLPVVVCAGPLSPDQARCLHFGAQKHRDPEDPTIDTGVRDAVVAADLIRTMEIIANEAVGLQRLPAIHAWPDKVAWLREKWAGPVLELRSAAELAELCDYPRSKVLVHDWIAPAVKRAIEIVDDTESAAPAPAPPCVHQVWLGDAELHPRLAGYAAAMVRAFPGWGARRWQEADMEELAAGAVLPGLLLDRGLNVGLRADIARLEILRQHGGVYWDTDFEPWREDLRPLFPREDTFYYGDEKPGRPANAMLAALKPGHPFVELYLRRIAASLKPVGDLWEIVGLTGPGKLAECLNWWVGDWKRHDPLEAGGERIGSHYAGGTIGGIWREAVYPYYYTEGTWATACPENYPQAWAAHHWEGGWNRN